MATQHSTFQLRPELFNQRTPMLWPIVFGALLAPYLPSRLFTYFLVVFTFVLWQALCWQKLPVSVGSWVVPLYLLFCFLILRKKPSRFFPLLFRSLILIISFFAVGYALAKEASSKNNNEILRLFWTIHPQFYLLFVISWLFSAIKKQDLLLSIHPMNLTWGTLWPQESSLVLTSKEVWEQWWQGLYNCMLGTFLFFLVFGLKLLAKDVRIDGHLLVGFYYVYFIIYLVASFNLYIGFSRMLRIRCPDPTHFLIFAKTPMEVWQRGSTYLYRFFLRFIYLPIYRKVKNYFITILVCLVLIISHMFLFHDIVVRNLYAFLVPELNAPNVPVLPVVIFSFSWALLWFTWIFIGSTVWRKILLKFHSPALSWLSVLATHIVAASIHPMATTWLTPTFTKLLN